MKINSGASGGLFELPKKSSIFASLFLLLSLLSLEKESSAITFDYVPRPEFVESSSELNVTSYLSQTSRLPCRVRHLGSKKVSWIRGKDLQVLSSGRTKFVNDIRVSILPGTGSSKKYDKRSIDDASTKPIREENHSLDKRGIDYERRRIVEKRNKFKGKIKNRQTRTANDVITKELAPNEAYNSEEYLHYEDYDSKKFHQYNDEEFPYYDENFIYKTSVKRNEVKTQNDKDYHSKDNNLYKISFTNSQDMKRNESFNYNLPSKSSYFSSPQPSSIPFFHSSTKDIKNYLKKHENSSYRQSNDILTPAAVERKEMPAKNPSDINGPADNNDFKNPIFIRPLSNSKNFKDNLASKRLHVPYNYLDAFWEPEDFTLQIKYTKRSDAGTYLCQINTEPRMTQVVHLRVVEMVAEIEGPKELYVKEGSPVVLICRINHGDNLPGFIFWYKNDRLVDYDSTKGRVEVDMSQSGQTQLIMKEVVVNDSANYTCAPSGGKADSVMLTIIEDKRPEAVQQSNLSPSILYNEYLLVYITLFQMHFIFTEKSVLEISFLS